MPVLLVIDDDLSIQHAFQRAFGKEDLRVVLAGTAAEALSMVARERPDVIVLDIQLPDLHGLELFTRLRRLDSRIPVIFITGHGRTETAIEVTRQGAFDYLLKPLDLASIRGVVRRALEISRLSREAALTDDHVESSERTRKTPVKAELVGQSAAMQEVYKMIGRVAATDVAVLIQGESGTGKELAAQAIFQHSSRKDRPFLAINSAALSESLLESELFGHEKGAFTDADRLRPGKFEQCSGGTLFLDEVGDMSPLTQSKLLRVLQEQTFERVGGSQTVQVDVRVIAATNRNLKQLAAEGKFRSDLYYRLSTVTIELPPLRERIVDLPPLVDYFVKRFGPELGKQVQSVAPSTLELLSRYSWPGNVRELQAVLQQALLRATGPVLAPDFLPPGLRAALELSGSPCEQSLGEGLSGWEFSLDDWLQNSPHDVHQRWHELTDRFLLEKVLAYAHGNLSLAARTLGIHRRTLRQRLRDLNLIAVDDADPPGEL